MQTDTNTLTFPPKRAPLNHQLHHNSIRRRLAGRGVCVEWQRVRDPTPADPHPVVYCLHANHMKGLVNLYNLIKCRNLHFVKRLLW